MYSTQPNGAEGATINPATINPAALNSELVNPNARGLKRSRSPEPYQDTQASGTPGDDGVDNPRKRGRPMKPRTSGGLPEPQSRHPSSHILPPNMSHQMAQQSPMPPHTPQSQNAPLPGQNYTPGPQSSPPPKTTPTKTTLKALPTVRDHTTDQLGPGGDEYIPREIDEAGEKKVMPNGQLLGNREYRCRTFLVPNRGDKLFMLATECARVLGYRDSYLLFNKNRSLFKIIANQVEKDDLIAIVTARSMFRQFGSRVIVNGRRVRDDYWEGKARKQGFTEADLAGEKRPGAAKAREAAAEANNNPPPLVGGPHGEIVYANTPQFGGAPQPQLVQPGMIGAPPGSTTRIPMITSGPDMNDNRTRDYSNFIKGGPRQEIAGPAYQDRTQSSPVTEIHAQAHHAAEFNRSVNQQREIRADYMQVAAFPTTHEPDANARYVAGTHAQAVQAAQPSFRWPWKHPQSTAASYNYGNQNNMWSHHQAPQTPQHYPGYTTQTQQSPHPQQSPAPQLRHPSGGTPQMPQPNTMQYPGMPGLNQGYANPTQGMYPPEQTPRQFLPQNPGGAPAVTQGWSNPQTSSTGNWWANQQQ
ncbi:chromatin structure-remodeling complex subunit rsc7 [Apiospora phragmitis]|uniref:Chromatin structure-remodeling complex subunit rsc7 n=1 Tax=Apiospora phragmitis TaxID=2905665 RepID=A0ABR1TPK0_9PEZI